MQHEMITSGPLLDPKGALCEAGYAKSLIKRYDRNAIKAGGIRIKEWDYYIAINDHYAVALTIADNSYMGLYSVSLLDFDKPSYITTSEMKFFTGGKTGLPASSQTGDVCFENKRISIEFRHENGARHLICHMARFKDDKPIDVDLLLTSPPDESMVIATPFSGAPKAFYYNQKINCMRAEGYAVFDGREYAFSPDSSFATLDWGRGVWTYSNTWYWGSGSGLADGVPFGFNIGYGFGDTSAASENMIFYNGKANKFDRLTFNIPQNDGQDDFMSPWTFTSSDGRFEMDFVPIIDRYDNSNVGIISSNQHQVFGRFTGTAVLDDGTVINIKDFIGFAEKVKNRW